IVFARGKTPVDLLVASKFLGVGAKQFGERVVDLEAQQAKHAQHREHNNAKGGQVGGVDTKETDALKPERKRASRCIGAGVHSLVPSEARVTTARSAPYPGAGTENLIFQAMVAWARLA